MNSNGYVDAPVYLQVKGERTRWRASDGKYPVQTAKVVGSTQGRPTKPQPDTVLVKVTLRIPVGAFDPLEPEAIVVVPADLTEAHPVEVEADDPREAGGNQP
ncbi:hypothetical protein LWF01_02835 [Saxibacter everestensis]|uniref:Uncharacterized protein n=1 Tax=Saxibacter everestensis TaxID=2909229 RepID=A0ABY8QUM1_9MICO|nr:hypothetical protein LWF01_02835 [Brevibacteriaceae bacterium ZFBP1038]